VLHALADDEYVKTTFHVDDGERR